MPSPPDWYVHFQGETLGPISTEKITTMLTQNRLQFVDFAWRAGLTKWVRISEIDEFAAHLPAYPKVGIPAGKADPEARPAPASAPQPSPKAEVPAPAKSAIASRFLRIPIDGKVDAAEHGKFEILNIAERGIFVAAKQALEIGTELQFRLESPELPESLQMRGVVIRHAVEGGQSGFAIEFVRLNPVHKKLIEQYVRKKSES